MAAPRTLGGARGLPPPRSYATVGRGAFRGQTTVTRGQHTYVQRTFVNRAGVRTNVRYGPRYWGARPVLAYHHDWGFYPWFWPNVWYGWSPWAWTWPWFGAPWYASWSWYWQPYPAVYTGPDYWVTDWVVSDMLNDAYQRGLAEGAATSSQPTSAPITDAEKEQLRAQVDQLAQGYRSEETVDLRNILANHPDYIFPVNQTISVMPTGRAAACRLTEGDLLKVATPPTDQNPTATMTVISSKYGSCPAGSQVLVSVNDLQDMLNTFAERVDQGMHALQRDRGQTQQPPTPQSPPQEPPPYRAP